MTVLAFAISVLQIVWINILLSGDNAVVIALASRSLPPRQRRSGIVLGAALAVALRIAMAFVVAYLLDLPFLKVAGGLLLLWIAVKLLLNNGADEPGHIVASETLWRAVRTIAVADVVMSLDNVLAVAAAAQGRPELFIFGLVVSIPLVIGGSQLILAAIDRLPILVWIGGALLGWVAGEMIVDDRMLGAWLGNVLALPGPELPGDLPVLHYGAAILGAVLVVVVVRLLRQRQAPAAS